MNESKFLIIGAHGQLGKALQSRYPTAQAVDSAELDITDATAVASFDWTDIEVVLNAAAYTNVDGAETPEGRVTAWQVNASGPRNLTDASLTYDFTLVHISSEYVFDGSQQQHSEVETLSPLGVYAQSKAAGDIAVSLCPKLYLLRTSWIIGDGANFVRTMLSLGQKGIAPTVVADQIGRPTFTGELVKAIDHLLATKAAYGIYNVSNGGNPVSWANVSREIFKLAGYNLPITDTTTVEYFASKPNSAPRPLNSTFDLNKLQATGFVSTDWQQDLARYLSKEATT